MSALSRLNPRERLLVLGVLPVVAVLALIWYVWLPLQDHRRALTERIADYRLVEASARAGPVGARADHGGGALQISRAIERAHQDCARAVDLARAVRRPEGLDHQRGRQVRLEIERPATDRSLVALRVLPLCQHDRRELALALAGFVQVTLRPHRHVHQVGLVADRVAVGPAKTGKVHGSDPRAGAPVHRPVHEYMVRLSAADRLRGQVHEMAGGLAAEREIEHEPQVTQRQRGGDG